MKMLNCPECNLTVTDAHEECPKCRTNLDVAKAGLDNPVVAVEEEKQVVKKRAVRKKDEPLEEPKSVKEEMIEAVIQAELEATEAAIDEARAQEELIAAVVEAEALAIIQEEEAAESLCENCLSPVEEGQNFCQLCGSSVEAIEEAPRPVIPKTDEESNRLIAGIGYFLFFFPILCGYYRNSKFAKFHAKQATLLFAMSIVLFIGLIFTRTIVDSTMIMYDGHRFSTAHLFHHYLRVMIQVLHLLPICLMLVGFVNSLQGKKRPLPIIGRFVKIEDEE